ncbi:PAS domain S-box protein [Paenibacillus sp.]|uniref:PAS domain S-box protein n=1 Tax=Paenibacillus sp. TaxID=58172 RepID=UPI002D7337D0|nr:PAS domain S-box protein [Paenibacillus sp.]HZG58003.1 PAS domain S-box protein [Paenibacillus sp.]
MTLPSLDTDSLFLHAFNHSAIGMAIVGLSGTFRRVNPSLCRLTGYPEAELVTKTFVDITHPDDVSPGERMRAELIEGTADSYQHEKRYIRKDGVHIWVHLSVSVVRDSIGQPLFFVSQIQDISHRKRAEHLLKSHMQQYKSLFDENPDLVYAVTLDGEVTSINGSVERITGYKASDWSLELPAPLRDGMRYALEHANEGSMETYRFETSIPRKDGGFVHLDVTLVPILVDGEAVGVYGIAKDVTKQAKLIHQLRESERKYRLLAEHSLDMIARFNPFGVFTYVSPSVAAVLGYTPEELIGTDGLALVHPEDAKSITAFYGTDATSDEQLTVFRSRTKNGDYIWIEGRTKSVRGRSGKVTEHIAVLRDVSDREAERARLREVEELYQLIAGNARDIITIGGPDGTVRYVSPAVTSLLGYAPEEIVGKTSAEWYHPEDLEQLRRRSFADEDVFWGRVLHKNGAYVWFETSVKFIRNAAGEVDKILGVSRDISERKRAEQELKAREEQYRQIVEHSPDAILISINGRFVYVNETAVELFGAASKEQLLSVEPLTLVHPDYRRLALQRRRFVQERRDVAELTECTYVRLDGRALDVEVKSIPTVYQDEDAVHTIVRDIAERKKARALMAQSEKLSAAGQLAAGIAHEIRNPLTSLKGFLQIMQRGTSKPHYYGIMNEELNRIESILTELLLLAKPHVTAMTHVPLRSIVERVVGLLESHANLKNIELAVRWPSDPLRIYGDENHLKQVFINFVKNAIEAMPDGGVIRIEGEAAEGMAVVRCVDQGHGIPAEKLPLVGRPFFTTKEYGTGLGLSVSYSIVEAHRGSVAVESVAGRGTTFTVKLPLAAPRQA